MATVTISIGRNIGSEPMTGEQWDSFAHYVAVTIRRESVNVFVDMAESVGQWEGIAEDSRTWVVEVASFDALNAIAATAQEACKRFRQDAIAVTVAGSFLITA